MAAPWVDVALTPSNRALTTMFGTSVGVTPLLGGAGVKTGVAVGKSSYSEGSEDIGAGGDEPWFDKSEIGGDRSAEETRGNLEI